MACSHLRRNRLRSHRLNSRVREETAFMSGGNPTRTKYVFAASLVTGSLLLIVLLYRFDPADSNAFPPCPFHKLTGFYCPGCGSLRAVHQIIHGNIIAAFRLNPLAMILAPFLMYAFIRQLTGTLLTKPLPQPFIRPLWIWILLGIIILYWIARNIPLWPFSLLAPY